MVNVFSYFQTVKGGEKKVKSHCKNVVFFRLVVRTRFHDHSSRYLLYGECDYSFLPYRCAGYDVPDPSFKDLTLLEEILEKFDVIGTLENMQDVFDQFERLTGKKPAKMIRARATDQSKK